MRILNVETLKYLAESKKCVYAKEGSLSSRTHIPASVLMNMQCNAVLDYIKQGLYLYENKTKSKE